MEKLEGRKTMALQGYGFDSGRGGYGGGYGGEYGGGRYGGRGSGRY
jgi:hypothetical protein